MIRLLTVTFLVLSAQVGAQNLHVFEDGQTIDAARFNENFTALKDAINSGSSPQDGVAYGSPVWVDSNGTLLTGRGTFGASIIWRVSGTLETIGYVDSSDNKYRPSVTKWFSNNDCDPSGLLGVTLDYFSMWVEDGVLKTEGPLNTSGALVNSRLTTNGDCRSLPGDSSSGVHEVIDTGVSAPSWSTDDTQMFADLR